MQSVQGFGETTTIQFSIEKSIQKIGCMKSYRWQKGLKFLSVGRVVQECKELKMVMDSFHSNVEKEKQAYRMKVQNGDLSLAGRMLRTFQSCLKENLSPIEKEDASLSGGRTQLSPLIHPSFFSFSIL